MNHNGGSKSRSIGRSGAYVLLKSAVAIILVGSAFFMIGAAERWLESRSPDAYFSALGAEKASAAPFTMDSSEEFNASRPQCLSAGQKCGMVETTTSCCSGEVCMPVGAYASMEGRFPYVRTLCVAVHPPAPKVFSAPHCQERGQYCGEGFPCCGGVQCDPVAHACRASPLSAWWPS